MEANDSNEQSKPNSGRGSKPCKERPWLWIEKAIVRTIRDVSDATNDVSSALAVKVALAEIASDEGSDTFTKSISEIAKRAGVKYRTATSMLGRFEALKIIAVQRNTIPGTKLQSPNTYTLGNHCLPLGNSRSQRSLPRYKKNREKSKKNDDEKPLRARDAEAAESSSSLLSLEEAQKHPYWKQFKRYCESKGGSPTLKGFNKWLESQPPPLATRKSSSQCGAKESPSYAAARQASMEQADKEHGISATSG
jgi:hypothetical protein